MSLSPVVPAIASARTNRFPIPTHHQRAFWDRVRPRPAAQTILTQAAALAERAPSMLTASGYLGYGRDGEREPFESHMRARGDRAMKFALAFCLQGDARFLDPVLDEVWAICEQTTWVIPAHGQDYADGLPDADRTVIDLVSAITAFTLAEIDHLLAERLHPTARKRIRREVRVRSTQAYLARNDYAWLGYGRKAINNWLAVCAACTGSAALYLEDDPETCTQLLHRVVADLDRYLDTYGPDGACPEGVGYWEKATFMLTAFAELLRSAGGADLFADPRFRAMTSFPIGAELGPGRYVPFSDTDLDRQPQRALLHRLAVEFDLPALAALDHEGSQRHMLTGRGPAEVLRDLVWYPDQFEPRRVAPPADSYFSSIQWLLTRADPDDPNGLVLAVKGGHNAEPHNHNDLGTFVVHWQGETLISEAAAGRYTRAYFQPETRYQHLATRSYGHSVPRINGCEQMTGRGAAAKAVQPEVRSAPAIGEASGLHMDLTDAYPPEADLARLTRRVWLMRATEPTVTVVDDYIFHQRPGEFESALITRDEAQVAGPQSVRIRGQQSGLLISADREVDIRLDVFPNTAVRHGDPITVTRIAFIPRQAAQEGSLRLDIRPDRVGP